MEWKLDRAPKGPSRGERDLFVREAWLRYGAGLTQNELTKRIGEDNGRDFLADGRARFPCRDVPP